MHLSHQVSAAAEHSDKRYIVHSDKRYIVRSSDRLHTFGGVRKNGKARRSFFPLQRGTLTIGGSMREGAISLIPAGFYLSLPPPPPHPDPITHSGRKGEMRDKEEIEQDAKHKCRGEVARESERSKRIR